MGYASRSMPKTILVTGKPVNLLFSLPLPRFFPPRVRQGDSNFSLWFFYELPCSLSHLRFLRISIFSWERDPRWSTMISYRALWVLLEILSEPLNLEWYFLRILWTNLWLGERWKILQLWIRFLEKSNANKNYLLYRIDEALYHRKIKITKSIGKFLQFRNGWIEFARRWRTVTIIYRRTVFLRRSLRVSVAARDESRKENEREKNAGREEPWYRVDKNRWQDAHRKFCPGKELSLPGFKD